MIKSEAHQVDLEGFTHAYLPKGVHGDSLQIKGLGLFVWAGNDWRTSGLKPGERGRTRSPGTKERWKRVDRAERVSLSDPALQARLEDVEAELKKERDLTTILKTVVGEIEQIRHSNKSKYECSTDLAIWVRDLMDEVQRLKAPKTSDIKLSDLISK